MTVGLGGVCLLCEGAAINSGSWPFHKFQCMLLGAPQGLQSGRSTSQYYCLLLHKQKRRMWFDKYLAHSYAFTLSNKMRTLCTTCYCEGVQSIRALSYLYQIRAEGIPADTRKISVTSLPCLQECHNFNLTKGKCVRIINFADTLNTNLGEYVYFLVNLCSCHDSLCF